MPSTPASQTRDLLSVIEVVEVRKLVEVVEIVEIRKLIEIGELIEVLEGKRLVEGDNLSTLWIGRRISRAGFGLRFTPGLGKRHSDDIDALPHVGRRFVLFDYSRGLLGRRNIDHMQISNCASVEDLEISS
jgi:hypothetical protein